MEYIERDPLLSRASFLITDKRQLMAGGIDFINENSFSAFGSCDGSKACSLGSCKAVGEERYYLNEPLKVINRSWPGWETIKEEEGFVSSIPKRVNILALGDVGGTMLTGLRLMGKGAISSIGIYDVNESNLIRWEFEGNQIIRAFHPDEMPPVKVISKEDLFNCDVFIFTASGGIPAVGSDVKDVRMAQLSVNKKIIEEYAVMAREAGFKGLFAVVSDPVDNLCAHVYHTSNKNRNGEYDFKGLRAENIQGFGLGVMNARALYYAGKDERFSVYPIEGRAFGPHGKDLVIADSIVHYNEELSLELTQKVVNANMELRAAGFKPYIAPALSSAALSIIAAIKGEWHYGSVFLDGVYMGVKNRYTVKGQETELIPMDPKLFARIQKAADGLRDK